MGGTSLWPGPSVNQGCQKPRYLRFSLVGENLIHSQEPLVEGKDVSSSLSEIRMSRFKSSGECSLTGDFFNRRKASLR